MGFAENLMVGYIITMALGLIIPVLALMDIGGIEGYMRVKKQG